MKRKDNCLFLRPFLKFVDRLIGRRLFHFELLCVSLMVSSIVQLRVGYVPETSHVYLSTGASPLYMPLYEIK